MASRTPITNWTRLFPFESSYPLANSLLAHVVIAVLDSSSSVPVPPSLHEILTTGCPSLVSFRWVGLLNASQYYHPHTKKTNKKKQAGANEESSHFLHPLWLPVPPTSLSRQNKIALCLKFSRVRGDVLSYHLPNCGPHHEDVCGLEVELHAFLTSTLYRGEKWTSRPTALHLEKEPAAPSG